jgi:peptidoglycan/LPS O-acetylase OafA/YrhL
MIVVLLKLQIVWLCSFVIGHVLADFDFSVNDNNLLVKVRELEAKMHAYKLPIFIISVLAIVMAFTLMDRYYVPGVYQYLIVSVLIMYFVTRNSYYKTILSWRVPFFLGNISFSLYLIHLPIICSLTSYMILHMYSLQGKIIACGTTLAVSIFLAYFYTIYIDKNSVRLANKVGDFFKAGT